MATDDTWSPAGARNDAKAKLMIGALRVLWLLFGAFPIAACSTAGAPTVIRAADPAEVVHATNEQARSPHVPAGTKLTLRLLDAIGSATSSAGERFGAIVGEPLRSPLGEVIVPTGAYVSGKVVSTGTSRARELVFELETVRVDGREIPIDARLIDATSERVRTDDALAWRSHPPATATFPAGTDEVGPRYLEPEALPGKGKWRGDVTLPIGSRLDMVLTRPILP